MINLAVFIIAAGLTLAFGGGTAAGSDDPQRAVFYIMVGTIIALFGAWIGATRPRP